VWGDYEEHLSRFKPFHSLDVCLNQIDFGIAFIHLEMAVGMAEFALCICIRDDSWVLTIAEDLTLLCHRGVGLI